MNTISDKCRSQKKYFGGALKIEEALKKLQCENYNSIRLMGAIFAIRSQNVSKECIKKMQSVIFKLARKIDWADLHWLTNI